MNIEHVCIYTSGNELDIKSIISAFQTIINDELSHQVSVALSRAPMRTSVRCEEERRTRLGPESESELPRHPTWSHSATRGPHKSHTLRGKGRNL